MMDLWQAIHYLRVSGKITKEECGNLLKKLSEHNKHIEENVIAKLQEQIPKWHLVADGDLPKDNKSVLCIDIYGDYFVGWYADKYWTDGESVETNVEAWMELPKFESEE